MRRSPPFGQLFAGKHAAEIFLWAHEWRDAFELTRDILSLSYALHHGRTAGELIHRSFNLILETAPLSPRIVLDLCCTTQLEFATLGLANIHCAYAYKVGSLMRSIEIAGLRTAAGKVIDLGANNNLLGKILVGMAPAVTEVIGIDVNEYGAEIIPGRLSFVRQQEPSVIPFDDASTCMVIMRYVLHHMEFDNQIFLINEAFRVLKDKGRLIIFEDTFSLDLPPFSENNLTRRFLDLDNQLDRYMVLAFMDASTCLVTDEKMPFYFTFRSIERWHTLLEKHGFSVESTTFWGIPFFSLHQSVMGVITCRKYS